MKKIRVAVVGVGYLGNIHIKAYRETEGCILTAICDTNKESLKQISENYGIPAYANYKELFNKVDAVSIVTPTKSHYRIACDFLKQNIHTFVEKPFTTNLKQADNLIRIARQNRLTLQVGHIERFNSAFSGAQKIISNPKFIECHRLSAFPNRSLDIGVVMDVMIHDIDIVLGLVPVKIKKIEAVGVNVLTAQEDIANARITFKNGCVANLTASRISDEALRKIRIFQENLYISLDYKNAQADVYKKEGAKISKKSLPIEKEQPLQKELRHFIDCIINKKDPLVSGEVARSALEVALKIQNQICKTL